MILATGGAGQVFPFTTNAATNTGDGMALALRAGAPLKDMEFVQYHPTALPNTGILITEAARGEGGLLLNGSGYRYLQDYGLGPAEPSPRKKAMELGPRDKLSQAFWQEQQRGRTVKTGYGDCVHLDIRHLGAEVIDERLPMVRELSRLYLNLDPVKDLIPVRPAVHYTMGGIATNSQAQTPLQGLYAAGECACVSINGANRLGSNSLTELLVFGKIAAEQALEQLNTSIPQAPSDLYGAVEAQCQQQQSLILQHPVEGENIFKLKQRLHTIVDQGLGIYRTGEQLSKCQQQLQVLAADWQTVGIGDKTAIFNTELILVYELGCMIEVAKAMCAAALKRKESRGSHQRLDFPERDDEQFLQHSVVSRRLDERWLSVDFQPVTITRLPPGVRVYGGDS